MNLSKNFFLQDIQEAKRLKSFWLKLSWLEFYGWYGKLNLGLAWVVISPLVFALGIGVVYAEAFDSSLGEHFLYVYGGYVCWLFIADTLGPGSEVYSLSYSYYSETKLPLIGFNIKSAIVRSYTFILNTATFLIVALALGHSINLVLLVFVFLYFVVISTLLSVFMSISLAYVPDLKLVIQNMMRLLFFLTPIVWLPGDDLSGMKALLVYANPFFYIVDLFRQITADHFNYGYVSIYITMFIMTLSLAVIFYSKFSRRMVFICK